MDGEQESIAEVELETPAIEPEIEAEEPVSLEDGEEPETEAVPEDDDSEEFDWNGQKVRGPKGLKDGVLMHADYTRKTQETSAFKKELEERASRLDQQFQASEEYLDARADLRTVTKELERFKDFGWNEYQALRQQDILSADETWNYVQHLKSQKNQLTATLSKHDESRSSEAQQSVAKRMNETQQFAQSTIKGWTPETDKQVIDFALSKGATPKDITKLMSPLVYEMIYLARIGAQALNKPASKPTPTQQPAPLRVVAAKANPPSRKSLSEMSMEEYAAARQAGRGG
ncbi:hypothetical protein CO731_04867 [Aminobacter sp. MSH1]|uniref:hypothetical protein n=1 Tax=Aminobacter sp. MSH1 TaxID=374606 RepID=UPI000D35DE82|nr:hypothetical protein [Aminobacter sp. MSH1]AWC25372.1 hypothetical protein CO731_04867 [Aminobacter sp. MSH1]